MKTKITLSIDSDVVTRAKDYATESGRSISEIVENYLRLITSEAKEVKDYSPRIKRLKGSFHIPEGFCYKDGTHEGEVAPITKELGGSIHFPEDFDYRDELTKALWEKYVQLK